MIRKALKTTFFITLIVTLTLLVVHINKPHPIIKDIEIGELWVMKDLDDKSEFVAFIEPIQIEPHIIIFAYWDHRYPGRKGFMSLTPLEFSLIFIKIKNYNNVGYPPEVKPKEEIIMQI